MGSSSLLDIIGSMLIGGLLLLVTLRMNNNATSNTFQSQEELTVQQNLTSLVQVIEADFRKIGFRNGGLAPPADSCIIYGRSDSVAFMSDINNDGTLDTVIWYLEHSPIIGCPNKNVRMLVRQTHCKGQTVTDSSNLGVDSFAVNYYETFKTRLTPPYIQGTTPCPVLMQLTLEVQPVAAYDTAYSSNFAFWQQTRLVSRNLTAR
jgi:type II secretory pathway component PulJ